MAIQVQNRVEVVSRTQKVEMPSLYEVIAAIGPVNSHSLARATQMSRFVAQGWLARQAAAGYLYFDKASGRYSVACPWPRLVVSKETPRRGVLSRAGGKLAEYAAMAWFGLMGDRQSDVNSKPRPSLWWRLFEDPRSPLVMEANAEAAWIHYIGLADGKGPRQ